LRCVGLVHEIYLNHFSGQQVTVLHGGPATHLLLFHFLLRQSLFKELSDSFLFDTDGFIASWRLIRDFSRHWISVWNQFSSISIDIVFLSLRAEFLLAFWLWLFEVYGGSFTVICDEDAIFILNDSDAVWLATLLWILDYLDRACWCLLVSIGSAWLTQSLLVQKSLVSCEFAKDQVLISVSLILLNQKIVGRSHRIVLIILDLFDYSIEAIKRLQIRWWSHL